MNSIKEHILVVKELERSSELIEELQKLIDASCECLSRGGKLLFCGNGGSAADAQHIAAELSGRFSKERKALAAIALSTNGSHLTAVANDYGYDHVFSRMVEGIAQENDILIAFSTSGNSLNILKAIESAKNIKMKVAGFTGSKGGKMKQICDFGLFVPSDSTPRIQEMHILLGHILCEEIENKLFPNQ